MEQLAQVNYKESPQCSLIACAMSYRTNAYVNHDLEMKPFGNGKSAFLFSMLFSTSNCRWNEEARCGGPILSVLCLAFL